MFGLGIMEIIILAVIGLLFVGGAVTAVVIALATNSRRRDDV